MNKFFQKIRQSSRLISLLGLSICLFFICAGSGGTISYTQKESPLTFKLIAVTQNLLSESSSSGSKAEVKKTFDWTVADCIPDPEPVLPQVFKAYTVSHFERNVFYIFNTASAP